MRLDELPPESSPTTRFLYATESDGSATFRIRRVSHDCEFSTASVYYLAADATAANGQHFNLSPSRSIELHDPEHAATTGGRNFQDVPVELIDDSEVGAVVRKAVIELSDPRNGSLAEPSRAALYLIDDDGPSRAAFAETSYAQDENTAPVKIPVFRAGDASAAATVGYTVESGPEPGATPDQDYSATSPGTITFEPGQRVRTIDLSLIADGIAEENENITISLTGEQIAEPSSTTLTIIDTDEPAPQPRSRFHHPRDALRYPYNDYRLREVHVFTKDTTGFEVTRVKWALRRNFKNDKCAWFNGKRFLRGPCDDHKWVKMRVFDPGVFYFYRLKALRPTQGTRIASYTAFSRAVDSAGNWENDFRIGKNANTFKVKRRG